MASNFPSSLDTFTNPSSTDAMDSVSVPHATQHSDLNDAVEALQVKVGVDSSAVLSSHDYKIAALEARNTAGLVLISRTTIGSAVSSVTVSSAFSADYDQYEIVISGGSHSGIAALNVNLDGLTSGYQYSYSYLAYAGGAQVNFVSTSATSWVNVGEGNGGALTAQFTLHQPFAAKRKGIRWADGFSGVHLYGAGVNTSTSSYTGFVVAAASGTMTGGYIDVYGYAKA